MCVCFHFRDQHCHACAADHCLVSDCDCVTFGTMNIKSHVDYMERTV